MRKLMLLFSLLCISYLTTAQSIGIGTTTPHPTAVLHIDAGISNSNGFLVSGGEYTSTSTFPSLGMGSRLMFYPARGAFRCGWTNGIFWTNETVGRQSVAMGDNPLASGQGAVALGITPRAIGYSSVALGYFTTANAYASTAIGHYTEATGFYSTAMGNASRAGGDNSTTMGYHTTSKGYASTVIGMFNDSLLLFNQISSNTTTPLFIIGNGNGHTERSNAMIVRKDGTVGVGTNVPTAKLHVKHASTISYPQLLLEEDDNDFARLSFKNNNTTNVWTIASSPNITNASAFMNFYYAAFGNIFTLQGDGNANLNGTLTNTSDVRLKKNIRPLTSAVEGIMRLSGYRYQWLDNNREHDVQIGVLAQEVQAVFPELVKQDEKGILSVNYSGLIPVLLEGAKEQQLQIEELKQRSRHQQKDIDLLKQQVAALLKTK